MRKHKYDIELGEHRDIIHYSVQQVQDMQRVKVAEALVAEEKVSSAELHLYEQHWDLHKNIMTMQEKHSAILPEHVMVQNNLNHGSVLMSSDREQVEAWAAPLLEEQRGHINAGAHVSAEQETQKAEAAALSSDELFNNLVVDHGDINRELHSKSIVANISQGQPQGTVIDHIAYHAVRSASSK